MLTSIKVQNGLSLVELLIGLLVGTVVVAAAIHIFTGSSKNQTDNTQINMLNQDLRAMMDMMVRDIRRAGYVNLPVINESVFRDGLRHNLFAEIQTTPDHACITYAYDRNSDAVLDNNERLGFKVANGVLSMRRSAPELACGPTGWQTITTPGVDITGLTFDLEATPLNVTHKINNPLSAVLTDCTGSDHCLIVRQVTITLTGALKDGSTHQTLTSTVRLRNDFYCKPGGEEVTARLCSS